MKYEIKSKMFPIHFKYFGNDFRNISDKFPIQFRYFRNANDDYVECEKKRESVKAVEW